MAKLGVPKSADELAQIGLHHHRAGDTAQAERSYRAALVRAPSHGQSLTLLSMLAMERRDYAEAVTLLEQALRVAPNAGVLHSNLGEALRRLDRKEEALSAFEQAVRLSPELAEAHYNLGLLLAQLGRLPEAIIAYENALELKPRLPGALSTLLAALRDSAEYAKAIAWYERGAPFAVDSVELRCAIAGVLLDVFRIDETLEHLQRALDIEPNSARAHADAAIALAERGEVEEALARLRMAIEREPANALYRSNLVYLTAFSSNGDAAQLERVARDFGSKHADALERPLSYDNARSHVRRLRIGYVSADFRTHAVAHFLLPLLSHHDRTNVEIFCYSNVRIPDALTATYQSLADGWRDVSSLDDAAAGALIRRDGIDILVDLSQHSAGQRLLLFGRKPAPIQVSWLGYPGPTGVSAIDYRITDEHLDPPAKSGDEAAFGALVRLPSCFWCYDPLTEEPEVNELPALGAGYITFGSFNSFKKLSDAALALWTRLLVALPSSRLLLVAPKGKARERVLEQFADGGVDAARIELVGHARRPEYLRAYHRIDIALDPLPYNGGTTSLDALWMGVPMVTLLGGSAVGRAGASLAQNLGLPQLIATSREDYVQRAVALASDWPSLAEMRKTLRARLTVSPLMDSERFARELELAYRKMWTTWLAQSVV